MLAELLTSIAAQDAPDIEVVVSDDASPDDTVRIVKGFEHKLYNLRFIRQENNVGLDVNFLRVVAAASGDYIWLMGDDDRLEPGGVERVRAALQRWPDVTGLTLGVIDYDRSMKRPTGVRGMPETQRVENARALFTIAADLLGFMSALVIKRDRWAAIAARPDVRNFENYYVQVYIIGKAVDEFGGWGILNEPCVGFRSGNDQFRTKLGWLRRLEVDVHAYRQIAAALFPTDDASRYTMNQKILETHVLARVRNAKTAPGATPGVLAALRYLYGPYHRHQDYWTQIVPTLLGPKWLLRAGRTLYRKFSRTSGIARARQLSRIS
jgi:glycosyltransferase involved in cell wall biosynthesis